MAMSSRANCKPSSDKPAILHIFRERPDINAVIHTHQPYATAVFCSFRSGLSSGVCITALANAAGGNVPITPYSAAGSIDMGIDTVKYVGNGHAVILSQHGVMTVGKDLNQALYAAGLPRRSRKMLSGCPRGLRQRRDQADERRTDSADG